MHELNPKGYYAVSVRNCPNDYLCLDASMTGPDGTPSGTSLCSLHFHTPSGDEYHIEFPCMLRDPRTSKQLPLPFQHNIQMLRGLFERCRRGSRVVRKQDYDGIL
jgi:hypothetical protein